MIALFCGHTIDWAAAVVVAVAVGEAAVVVGGGRGGGAVTGQVRSEASITVARIAVCLFGLCVVRSSLMMYSDGLLGGLGQAKAGRWSGSVGCWLGLLCCS